MLTNLDWYMIQYTVTLFLMSRDIEIIYFKLVNQCCRLSSTIILDNLTKIYYF